MSDLSLVWHEYERSSQMASELLTDVVALKRTQFKLPGADNITTRDLARSRSRLADFVVAVVEALEPAFNTDSLNTWSPQENENISGGIKSRSTLSHFNVPGPLMEHLREANASLMPRYVDNLIDLAQELRSAEALSSSQWELLEGLTGHVHQEASRLFRRLCRKNS